MQRILVSACLLGIKVRYDGGDCLQNATLWNTWQQEGRLVSVCPEVAGGLIKQLSFCKFRFNFLAFDSLKLHG